MPDCKYLVVVDEPLGPFKSMSDRREAYHAQCLFGMGYRMNTRHWEVGSKVIHMGDAKRPNMLMVVCGYTRKGLVKTVYLDYLNHPRKVWVNGIENLLDPADFGIEVPNEERTIRKN